MNDSTHCLAQTQAGAPCKNRPMQDSSYCYTHRRLAAAPPAPIAAPAPAAVEADHHEALQKIISELNAVAQELQVKAPQFAPPPFTPQGMRKLLKESLDQLPLGVLRDLQENLAQTPPQEFLNPETWKGLWYTLNYLVQSEAGEAREGILKRLARLPGVGALSNVQEMLKDTPPQEFLKPDTWKGMWFIVNYELQNQARAAKQRLLGSKEE